VHVKKIVIKNPENEKSWKCKKVGIRQ